jgi:hypothetical protein
VTGGAPSVATPPATESTSERGYQLEILLVSFAALLLEISYTRVVSFKLFYYYTYLVIGLALLGIGAGGVFVAVSARIRRASTDSILLGCLILGSASIIIGYFVIALTTIDTVAIWDYGTWSSVSNVLRLVVMCLVLFAPLGFGFIFFEIVLIQRLTLFLGYPTSSLTVTLASILLFTGVRALLSGRYQHHRRRVLPVSWS